MCGNLACSFGQLPDKGSFWRGADLQATISRQSQQPRGEYWSGRGRGVGPMVSSRGGFQGIHVLGTWPSTTLSPALSCISTYRPSGVHMRRPCGLQVAVSAEIWLRIQLAPRCGQLQPLRVPVLGPPLPPFLPLSPLTVRALCCSRTGTADCTPHPPG